MMANSKRRHSCRLSNKLYLKVADLAALEGDYYKAIANYEKVARSSVSNQLMKWSVKDYFLKAGMCHLASGVRLLLPSLPHLPISPPTSVLLHLPRSSSLPPFSPLPPTHHPN